MSLKMEVKIRDPQKPKKIVDFLMVCVRIPNSASSSQTNGRFGEPHHVPLARDD